MTFPSSGASSAALLDVADRDGIALRFAVGARVRCRVREGGWYGPEDAWLAGTVVQLFLVLDRFPPGKCAPYQVELDATTRGGRLIFVPTDTDGDIKTSYAPRPAPRPPAPPPTSRVAGASGDADSAAGEPRTPQTSIAVSRLGVEEARRRALALGCAEVPRTPQTSAAAPRAPAYDYANDEAYNRRVEAFFAEQAAWHALPLAARRRREDAARREVIRKSTEASQRKAARREVKVAARVEAVPPMPRKLRPKPRARQGNSHFVGPGKFYADWNEFYAELDKWEAERDARKQLMAKRHKAQQRVFDAKHPEQRCLGGRRRRARPDVPRTEVIR